MVYVVEKIEVIAKAPTCLGKECWRKAQVLFSAPGLCLGDALFGGFVRAFALLDAIAIPHVGDCCLHSNIAIALFLIGSDLVQCGFDAGARCVSINVHGAAALTPQ